MLLHIHKINNSSLASEAAIIGYENQVAACYDGRLIRASVLHRIVHTLIQTFILNVDSNTKAIELCLV